MGSRLPLFVAVLVCLDVAVVLALKPAGLPPLPYFPAATQAPPEPAEPAAPDAALPQDAGWALCLTRFDGEPVTPTSAAVTYLDTGLDDDLTADTVRSWFGALDGRIIDVYKLEQADGRRRISFEVTHSKWPEWQRVARGQSGETVCNLVRAALLAAGVGRPVPVRSDAFPAPEVPAELAPSRHHFEFIYARRPALYRSIEWVGPLDHALELDVFVSLLVWLRNGDAPQVGAEPL